MVLRMDLGMLAPEKAVQGGVRTWNISGQVSELA